MGRYYSGDISGKFIFGVQDSTAASRFGVEYSEPAYIEYYFETQNLPALTTELAKIAGDERVLKVHKMWFEDADVVTEKDVCDELGIDKTEFTKLLSEAADFDLGKKILICVTEHGECSFDCDV